MNSDPDVSKPGLRNEGRNGQKQINGKNTNLVELVILPIKEGKVYILSVVLLFLNIGGDLEAFSYSSSK